MLPKYVRQPFIRMLMWLIRRLLSAGLLCVWSLTLVAQDSLFRMEFTAQVMTDVGYNFQQLNTDFADVMRPTQLPSYANEYGSDGNVYASVRQSMFMLKAYIPTAKDEFLLHFGFDLLGVGANTGSTSFHMIFAYAEWGALGLGHNWSLFSDIGGYPDIIEYWGPVGLSLCKSVQLRFIPFKGDNRLAFALENPGASSDEGLYADRIELDDVVPKFDLPDLTGEFRMTRDWGYVELAGVLRKIEWVDQGTDAYNLSGKAFGWGLNLSSNLNLGARNVLVGQTVIGKGIQNLMNDAPTDIGIQNDFGNAAAPIKGVAIPLWSYSLYINHQWNARWHSALGYSAIHIENTNGQADNAFKMGQYASTNLLYSPNAYVLAGMEFQWIRRVNKSDAWAVSASKVQFSVRYLLHKGI